MELKSALTEAIKSVLNEFEDKEIVLKSIYFNSVANISRLIIQGSKTVGTKTCFTVVTTEKIIDLENNKSL